VEIPKGAQIADGIDGVRKAVREQLANGRSDQDLH
jgi:hypothetical protein